MDGWMDQSVRFSDTLLNFHLLTPLASGLARTRNFLDDPFGLVRPKKCKIIRQVEKVERPYLTDAMALIRPRLSGCHGQNTYCTRCGCCQEYTQRRDACLFPHP